MSLYSDHARNVNAIRRDIAQAEADKIRRKGDFWGGTLQMLGNLPLEILNQRDQRRAADDAAGRQAEKDDLARRKTLAELDELTAKGDERTRARDREGEIAKAASPFDVANVIGRSDPKAGTDLHNANRLTAGRMLLGATAANLEGLKKSIARLVGEEEVATLPATFDKATIQAIARAWAAPASDLFNAETQTGYTLGPGSKRFDAQGNEIASVPPIERPAAEGGFSLAPGGKRFDAQGKEIASVPDRPPTAARDDRIVQVMGPNGTPIWVKESDAVGKPAAQAARAVTGAERQALAYYNRAKEAVDTIAAPQGGLQGGASLEDRVAKSGMGTQVGLQYAPNFMQTSDQQAYRQAQRAFTEARLRKESGAAIPAGEYENDAKTYFAQPGDKPETVEQKRKARNTVLNGLKFGAGKAYDEFYGDGGMGGQSFRVGDYQIEVVP